MRPNWQHSVGEDRGCCLKVRELSSNEHHKAGPPFYFLAVVGSIKDEADFAGNQELGLVSTSCVWICHGCLESISSDIKVGPQTKFVSIYSWT